VAYFLLGEAAEQIGYREAALSYYQEASRIASTASFRFSEHCTLNKGGSGFQSAGQACFGVPIENASREAVARVQTSASSTASASSGNANASPGAIVYEGAIDASFSTAQQQLQLQIGPQQIVGRLKTQMGILAGDVPVTGTYANGRCVVQLRGGEDMVGTCDREVFAGFVTQRKTGKQTKKFWFATASRWVQGKPAEVFGTGQQQAQLTRVVTASGRARYLVEPDGRCGPDSMLLKGYCFDEAIRFLQRDPAKKDLTVIAARRSLPLGARIGRGEYTYVQVKRRPEGGFYADRDLHGYSKVQVPQGCMYRGAGNEGFIISIAEGRKAAVEVTDYSCG
jgi:hypothetical protein